MLFPVVLMLASPASATWKEKVLYSFRGVGTDGATPVGAVIFDKQGNLYGATRDGGSSSCRSVQQCGTVYQLAPPAKQGDPWTESVLYVFKGNASKDGASPYGGLVIDSAGNIYGTTGYGGTGNCVVLGTLMGCGTVFELSPPEQKGGKWTETVLYSFPTPRQGFVPAGDLVFDSAGNLYGATTFGGGYGTACDPLYRYCGAVFKLSPPKTKDGKWTEKVLHGFKGGTDGANPNGGLVLDSKRAIYGTTSTGGNQGCSTSYSVGCGTAFELKQSTKAGGSWTEKMLHRFANGKDGAGPNGGLIFDAKGSLYGTAGGGGSQGLGVAFRLAPEPRGRWSESVLHNFTDNIHGRGPGGPLTFDASGDLYGEALAGAHFLGVLFRLRFEGAGTWTFSDIYSFAGPPDGPYPEGPLVFDEGGNAYSITQAGGTGQACQGGL